MEIKIGIIEEHVCVTSPYHPNFISRAHNLGGIWSENKKQWLFDYRDIERVRKMCLDIFGDDGEYNGEYYTAQFRAVEDISVSLGGIYLAGYMVAKAWSRDGGARLGEGVILLEGSIGSGGSRSYWKTIVDKESIIEIKDMTLHQLHKAIQYIDRYGKWEMILNHKQSLNKTKLKNKVAA